MERVRVSRWFEIQDSRFTLMQKHDCTPGVNDDTEYQSSHTCTNGVGIVNRIAVLGRAMSISI